VGIPLLKRRELPVLGANLIYVPAFTIVALRSKNHEFLLYVLVILLVAAWVVWKQRSIQFGPMILWGLTLWGLMHMAGGNLRVAGGVLYGLQLIPKVLKYDQLVHAVGFGVATLVCYHLLKGHLAAPVTRRGTILVLVILMSSGLGAVNEIIEFLCVKSLPRTGVGGYDNTLWDLVFNLIGGILAAIFIALRPDRPDSRRGTARARIPA